MAGLSGPPMICASPISSRRFRRPSGLAGVHGSPGQAGRWRSKGKWL